MLKRALFIIFLAGLFSAAWGQDFGLDIGCCSDPLSGNAIPADANGGGTFGFYNQFDFQITELSYVVHVPVGFDATHLDCVAFDFFVCHATFDPIAEAVTLDFTAPNAPEAGGAADGGPTDTDTESGEGEGLPTLLAGCGTGPGQQDPNTGTSTVNGGDGLLPCSYKGHFEISFNNFGGTASNPTFNNAPSGSGDWVGAVADLNTINGQLVPEPSTFAFLGTCFVVGCFARRYAKRS